MELVGILIAIFFCVLLGVVWWLDRDLIDRDLTKKERSIKLKKGSE